MGVIRHKSGIKGVTVINGKYVIEKQYRGFPIYKTLNYVKDMSRDDVLKAITAEQTKIDNPALVNEFTNSSSLTVQDAMEYIWEKRLSHKSYAKDIKYPLSRVNDRLGSITLANLRKSDIETYIRDRKNDKNRNKGQNRPIGQRTIQIELQYLSSALNLLVDDGHIEKNHISKFTKVKLKKSKPIIIDEGNEHGSQFRSILKCVDLKTKPLIEFLYETGMRPKELFNLRWSWITKHNDICWSITIPAEDVVDGEVVFKEKTGNNHIVPLSKKAQAILIEIGAIENSTKLVFPSPVTLQPRKDIRGAFNTALTKAGLDNTEITPYALRRTRLSIWDEIDANASREASGHSARDVHEKNYVNISLKRLFKLVGLDYAVE